MRQAAPTPFPAAMSNAVVNDIPLSLFSPNASARRAVDITPGVNIPMDISDNLGSSEANTAVDVEWDFLQTLPPSLSHVTHSQAEAIPVENQSDRSDHIALDLNHVVDSDGSSNSDQQSDANAEANEISL